MNKELIARRLLRIAFLMLMVWLVLLATSCGGKKKLVQKSEFSTEVAKVERVKELVEKDVVTDITTNTKSESHSITENSEVSLTQADPEKEITLIDPQGRVTKIKGANAVISNRKESVSKIDTFGQNLSKTDKSKTAKQSESEIDLKASGSKKDIDIEKEGKFPWWWLILIALSIAIYLWIGNLKKTYMPWKWFTS